jgi:hypothetical protein
VKTAEVVVTLSFDEDCDPMPAAHFLKSEIKKLFRAMDLGEEMPGLESWDVDIDEPT